MAARYLPYPVDDLEPGRVRMLVRGAVKREEDAWHRAAWETAYLVNIHRDPKKYPNAIQPIDLLRPKPEMTPADIARSRRRLVDRFGLDKRRN